MGVADADRWAIDHIFAAGKPMMRVHTGGATGGSVVQAAHSLVSDHGLRGLRTKHAVIGDAQEPLHEPDICTVGAVPEHWPASRTVRSGCSAGDQLP